MEVGGKSEIDDLTQDKAGELAMSKRLKYANSSASYPGFWAGIRELLADIFSKNVSPSLRQVPGLVRLSQCLSLNSQPGQRLWETRQAALQASGSLLHSPHKSSLCRCEESGAVLEPRSHGRILLPFGNTAEPELRPCRKQA